MNKELILLVGPPGSGKSTAANLYKNTHVYINQDSQGKNHLNLFQETLNDSKNIIVDRMNFSREQRDRYLNPAKEMGYNTKIIVLHESYNTCMQRMKNRNDHETIKNERDAARALNTFFSKYERVENSEADTVIRKWPIGPKEKVIISDLDGTLCNIDHRLHFVKGEGKKDWKNFFYNIPYDTPNQWCKEILESMPYTIVYCSGRPDDYKTETEAWLVKNAPIGNLFMRGRGDFRPDNIVKEVILEFELLTRYEPYFIMDDRKQVVDMWRKHGFTVLACAEGEF